MRSKKKRILMKKHSVLHFNNSQGLWHCTAQKGKINFEQVQRQHFKFFQQSKLKKKKNQIFRHQYCKALFYESINFLVKIFENTVREKYDCYHLNSQRHFVKYKSTIIF